MKIAWVTSWERTCGIADYSKVLWPRVLKELENRGHTGFLVSIDEFGVRKRLAQKLERVRPDVIHFQHEYGLYGGKNPPLYSFPSLIKSLKTSLPQTKLVATAHTVLPQNYRYPTQSRGWQTPLRVLANASILQFLKNQWHEKTWGRLDGVIVHSRLQVKTVEGSGCSNVTEIPHFVAVSQSKSLFHEGPRKIMVFGFFSEDKGQDVVIDAFAKFKDEKTQLILAGGVRRKADQKYFEMCKNRIQAYGLEGRVKITGFLALKDMEFYFSQNPLVVAPFRSTTGSGSITQALGRSLPVLASDVLLNLEIAERQPGALAFFKAGDAQDLSEKMKSLVNDENMLESLSENAGKYAANHTPEKMARKSVDFYEVVS